MYRSNCRSGSSGIGEASNLQGPAHRRAQSSPASSYQRLSFAASLDFHTAPIRCFEYDNLCFRHLQKDFFPPQITQVLAPNDDKAPFADLLHASFAQDGLPPLQSLFSHLMERLARQNDV